jgi:hypothetical protein
LENIAFLFEPLEAVKSVLPKMRDSDARPRPMTSLFGVDALWPHNLPALQEIYFIDPSISPKAGARPALRSMPSFAGSGANFYEVDLNDTHVWDITTTDGVLKPVFEEAKGVQEHYALLRKVYGRYYEIYKRHSNPNTPPILVKVLACVPTEGEDAAERQQNRRAFLELISPGRLVG